MTYKKQDWFVYMLQCSDASLYTGITTDVARRVHEHNHTQRAARYTRARRPVKLVYQECLDSRPAATRREWEIRQLDRSGKMRLLNK